VKTRLRIAAALAVTLSAAACSSSPAHGSRNAAGLDPAPGRQPAPTSAPPAPDYRLPATLKITDVTPRARETVGVGMPVIVTFNHAVPKSQRSLVEHALQVTSTGHHQGAWNWMTTSDGVQEAIFRLQDYWNAHEQVTLTAHLSGGRPDYTRSFRIGDDHRITVSSRTRRLVVTSNGTTVRSWAVSLGSHDHDSWITYSGTYLTMGSYRNVEMTSRWMGIDPKDSKHGGYDENVPYAVQISDSGEYIHSNEGDDASCLGHRDCSHGCVRSDPAGARWFYGWAQRGDVVTITGTGRKLAWDNGWSFYVKSWTDWLQGSALGTPVTT
jgi:lipoprotein-anchoring transpeptidase ErfK/SrfK